MIMNALKGSGYASVFNEIDSHGTVVLPGAYRQFIQNFKRWGSALDGIELCAEHGEQVGWVTDLEEDDYGLWVEFELFRNPAGLHQADAIKCGLRAGLSIGPLTWRPGAPSAEAKARGARGSIRSIWLQEISLTSDPACSGASVRTFAGRDVGEVKYVGCRPRLRIQSPTRSHVVNGPA